MADKNCLKLLNGKCIPKITLGTFKDKTQQLVNAVKQALLLGYRHLDLAFIYENEKLIKQAISQINIPREDIFITNKLSCSHHHKVLEALDEQLTNVGVNYFDLYLMHWPMAFSYKEGVNIPLDKDGYVIPLDKDYVVTWKEMQECKSSGKVKSLGVSNFNEHQLQRLYDEGGHIWPEVNQIEINPYCPEWNLVKFCQDRNIVVEAYAPFGSSDRPWRKPTDPVVLKDETILNICNKLNSDPSSSYKSWTPAKVIIKWVLQRNIVIIIKSVSNERLKENLDAANLPNLPQWCSAERLHLTKQSVDEAKLAISEVKREICNIQEQLKNACINDDVNNPRIPSFAGVVRREVARSIFATSQLQKELPPLKLLQQCDRESRRSQNVIISGLQNSDSDKELVDELFKELGVKVPLDLNVKLKRFISSLHVQ
ncbi:hypothetical protein GJ496_003436 [Pomphorhynchus laevis]|nr:hypothetical protein GJ496_003436 [Pomphorhynchus laevis]